MFTLLTLLIAYLRSHKPWHFHVVLLKSHCQLEQCALVNIILEGKVRIIGIKTKKNSKRSFRVYCLIERCLDYQISSATIIERYSDKSVLH